MPKIDTSHVQELSLIFVAGLSLIFHWLFVRLVLVILPLSSLIRELGFLGEHIEI